jgi:chemotaxis protein MotB
MAEQRPPGQAPTASKPQAAPSGRMSVRRRPRGTEDEPAHEMDTEEWRLTYMDTITLLVAMFVMVLSLADFEGPGAGSVAGQGRIPAAAPLTSTAQTPGSFQAELPPNPETGPATRDPSLPPVAIQPRDVDFANRQLVPLGAPADPNALFTGPLPAGVTRTIGTDGVQLQISESVLFPSGSADLAQVGLTTLDQLIPLLRTGNYAVSVEGHSDDRAIATDRYPSNWELSSARASRVVRHFVERGIAESRLRAIGYAATKPVDRTDSNEGRARNRRVTLLLDVRPPARP